jgi:uncharacterized membrane protein YhhN
MSFIKKYGAIIFAVLLLAHCFFIYEDLPQLRMVSKLVLLPFLLIYLSASREGTVNPLVVVGLLFSFAGDLLLSFTGEIFFLLGMFAFICTHICNLVFFIKLQKGNSVTKPAFFGTNNYIYMLLMIILMVRLGTYVISTLGDKPGNLLVPIGIYILIISAMAVAAAGTIRNPFIEKTAARFFIPGAILFALSDSILAMNKFLWHEPWADIAVMATYGVAQFLLVKGFTRTTQLKVH